MTNTELIAKIKAEIERRLKDYWEISFHDTNSYNKDTNVKELKELLSFLSTLESEKPVPNDLEEAANKFAVFYDQGTCDGIVQDCFIAGAKWQAEQDEKEQADLFTIVALDAAQRAKNKMMEDAKEGKIIFLLNGDVAVNIGDTDEYKLGQKVRVIICKKED